MSQLTYRLSKSETMKTKTLNMDSEQQELFDIVKRWTIQK
jgi:hypothetical protein